MEVEGGGWDKRERREENDKEENTEGRKPVFNTQDKAHHA